MPAKLYRCLNQKCVSPDGKWHDFAGTTAKCPRCGIESTHPKFGHIIKRLAAVHFDPPSAVPGIGENHRACDPTKHITAPADAAGNPSPFHAGTGDPLAVTCPDCLQTEAWKTAMKAVEEDETDTATRAALTRLQQYTAA